MDLIQFETRNSCPGFSFAETCGVLNSLEGYVDYRFLHEA